MNINQIISELIEQINHSDSFDKKSIKRTKDVLEYLRNKDGKLRTLKISAKEGIGIEQHDHAIRMLISGKNADLNSPPNTFGRTEIDLEHFSNLDLLINFIEAYKNKIQPILDLHKENNSKEQQDPEI